MGCRIMSNGRKGKAVAAHPLNNRKTGEIRRVGLHFPAESFAGRPRGKAQFETFPMLFIAAAADDYVMYYQGVSTNFSRDST